MPGVDQQNINILDYIPLAVFKRILNFDDRGIFDDLSLIDSANNCAHVFERIQRMGIKIPPEVFDMIKPNMLCVVYFGVRQPGTKFLPTPKDMIEAVLRDKTADAASHIISSDIRFQCFYPTTNPEQKLFFNHVMASHKDLYEIVYLLWYIITNTYDQEQERDIIESGILTYELFEKTLDNLIDYIETNKTDSNGAKNAANYFNDILCELSSRYSSYYDIYVYLQKNDFENLYKMETQYNVRLLR